jgi:hypothetical protein
MTSACTKMLGCGLMLLLAAGMKPQTSTPAASNQPAQAAPPAPPAQAPAPEKDKEQKPAPVGCAGKAIAAAKTVHNR